MYCDNAQRSIAKSISWRVCATITTIVLVFAITGKFEIAATIGALEVVSKMIIYYFHERVWNRIPYGRQNVLRDSTEEVTADVG